MNRISRRRRTLLAPCPIPPACGFCTRNGPATVGQIIEKTGLKQANASSQSGSYTNSDALRRQRDGKLRFRIRLPLVFERCAMVFQGLSADTDDPANRG